MSVPLPGERVRVELGSMSSVNLRISANICTNGLLNQNVAQTVY